MAISSTRPIPNDAGLGSHEQNGVFEAARLRYDSMESGTTSSDWISRQLVYLDACKMRTLVSSESGRNKKALGARASQLSAASEKPSPQEKREELCRNPAARCQSSEPFWTTIRRGNYRLSIPPTYLPARASERGEATGCRGSGALQLV